MEYSYGCTLRFFDLTAMLDMTPNGWSERRARRCMRLALYPSLVRSSDLLGGSYCDLAVVVSAQPNPEADREYHEQVSGIDFLRRLTCHLTLN